MAQATLEEVTRLAEQMMSATIATAQATAVDRRTGNLFFCARQQGCHVLSGSTGVASLELDRLSLWIVDVAFHAHHAS